MNMSKIVLTYRNLIQIYYHIINYDTEEQVVDPIEQAYIEVVPKYPGKADNEL